MSELNCGGMAASGMKLSIRAESGRQQPRTTAQSEAIAPAVASLYAAAMSVVGAADTHLLVVADD